jgi:organic radical activating enzyme
MKLQRQTVSFCNVCYKEIPATISVEYAGAVMRKRCSVHGDQFGLCERDPVFYTYILGLQSPSIYSGYFIDVTRRCNLRCEYCFYPLATKDPDGEFALDRILEDCLVNRHRAPFIFTGGEPTLHPEIEKLISETSKIGPVELLTNGVRLADPEFYDSVMPHIVNDKGEASLNLSIHGKETEKWRDVVSSCRRDKIKIESALIVIDSEASFTAAIALAKELSDVVMTFRIKAATKLWNEKKPKEKIFVSDMWHWLEKTGKDARLVTETMNDNGVVEPRHNKSVFANVEFDGMFLMLVSWHDVTNVDLVEIRCAPYYRARNGEVCNLVTTNIINEGMEKGWMKGQKI